MIKLVLSFGLTMSILGASFILLQNKLVTSGTYQSSARGSSSSTTTGNISPLTVINDIKEIFGIPPIGSQLTSKFAGGGGGGPEGVGYLPPKSFRGEGTGEEVSGRNENESSTETPFFRIFILPKNDSTTTTTTESSMATELSAIEVNVDASNNNDTSVNATSFTIATQTPEELEASDVSVPDPANDTVTTLPGASKSLRKEESAAEFTALNDASPSTTEVTESNNAPEQVVTTITNPDTTEATYSRDTLLGIKPASTLEPPSKSSLAPLDVSKATRAPTDADKVLRDGLYLPPSKEFYVAPGNENEAF